MVIPIYQVGYDGKDYNTIAQIKYEHALRHPKTWILMAKTDIAVEVKNHGKPQLEPDCQHKVGWLLQTLSEITPAFVNELNLLDLCVL